MIREFFGSDVENALDLASKKIKLPVEKFRYRVLPQDFGKPLQKKKVGLIVEYDEPASPAEEPREREIEKIDESIKNDPVEFGRFVLERLIEQIGFQSAVEAQVKNEQVILTIRLTEGALGTRRGDMRELRGAIQYLINRVVYNGREEGMRFIIDFGGDLSHREGKIGALAKILEEKVKNQKKVVQIKLMDAQDRRLLHLALIQSKEVETTSEGEGRFRVISVKARQ